MGTRSKHKDAGKMKTIRVDLPYEEESLRVLDRPGAEQVLLPSELTRRLLLFAVASHHRSGMERKDVKVWNRIKRALDGSDSGVRLSLEQFEFLDEAVVKARFPAQDGYAAEVLWEHFDEVRAQKPEPLADDAGTE